MHAKKHGLTFLTAILLHKQFAWNTRDRAGFACFPLIFVQASQEVNITDLY